MSCSGCAQRGRLIGEGARALQRGAWSEAAQAAQAVVVSVKVDATKLAGKVAAAAAAVAQRAGR
ncbi:MULTISPECIES: hypothetical protein [unclassified Bosea (in: a-proteobacteria)]|uniref:hypothetical protein n=1 Tax=unclassified Bosea (in: a-proteobacteria) TaxID=2653178 RepID=UPI000F75B47A|nr:MULTISPECIES: hypothetical protein [unclassified Bosea (in: a-proteobacteria)]AZO77721.1 hypothetical protein BLM15_08905 [Bosea sp. Tri-49]RXT18335.1 hypothetical protein B5U98_24060 [Bosea sp. Tri-39]RXT32931.1 hypothetical protein B5U99_30405 [Bosea sp. Tri-54]